MIGTITHASLLKNYYCFIFNRWIEPLKENSHERLLSPYRLTIFITISFLQERYYERYREERRQLFSQTERQERDIVCDESLAFHVMSRERPRGKWPLIWWYLQSAARAAAPYLNDEIAATTRWMPSALSSAFLYYDAAFAAWYYHYTYAYDDYAFLSYFFFLFSFRYYHKTPPLLFFIFFHADDELSEAGYIVTDTGTWLIPYLSLASLFSWSQPACFI